MEEKNHRTGSSPQHLRFGKPNTSLSTSTGSQPRVDGQEGSAMDIGMYQRPHDEGSYGKVEGPSPSDTNELENVLDSILDSTNSTLQSWTHFPAPELQGIQVSSLMCPTAKGKSPRVHSTSELKETSVWTGVTLNEDEEPGFSIDPQIKGKNNEEDKDECSSIDMDINVTSMVPPDLNFSNMTILPLNPAYLALRARQILDLGENGQKTPDRSQHPVIYIDRQSNTKQSFFLNPETQPDPSIKKEESGVDIYRAAKEASPGQDCGISSLSPSTPDHPMDYILYKTDSVSAYDMFRVAHGKVGESPLSLSVPSTSSPLQTFYHPVSLNGNQHVPYQPGTMKESYLPEIQLPYVQYFRTDSDPDHSGQYGFDNFPQKICLICGDEASGCHYGVLTCGSCKVFFKRAIEGQHNYLCAGRNDCIVDKIRRKNCPSCRLRKCCQAGMVLGGRKFKKFGRIKTGREIDTVLFPSPLAVPMENQQIITRRVSTSPTQEIQFYPELLQILQSIEPEVVYAGYDNTQPETPSALLSSLNQLCERQLLCVVKWSKSLPGFKNLHIDDQITLLQYSWMSLMVFAMGWRSYKHVSGQMLYFAPDLILNEQRMKESSFYSLCLSMWQLPQEFVKLQVSHEEFLCMKALLLLNTIPLEGLKSQTHFDEMRSNYIRELAKAIGLRHKGVISSSQRFYQLTKLMDSMHELVKQLHLYCLNTFLQSRSLSVEFPEMMSEVISAQLPKILAGMVKPLVFHKK
ncbi:hypothetical protein GDO86_004703 [Hymenochirus boettgeri]|uniref:Progesterone receptor n=1 Tax=Hymenochirus boettgeri TaxID=247094 RepID=A0A8T2K9C7_9PIPI|nr:hypothetical protein GDO86_004703 [Hymenochirus boettgeri]